MRSASSGGRPSFWAWAALTLALLGCTCEERARKRAPSIEVLAADGSERRSIEFGTVQVDATHSQKLRVRNNGAAELNIRGLTSAPPFGTATQLPVVVGVAEETELVITYHPTVADRRDLGKLLIASDDPARMEVSVDLFGMGIQAVALATPNPIDFKDVYVKETGKLTLTLSNAGSNQLEVKGAAFSPEVPASVSADLSRLVGKVAAGGSASLEIFFSPTEINALSGALELTLDPLQGGKLSVPLRGRGVAGLPQLCFRDELTSVTSCTDPSQPNPFLSVRFGALCDHRLFPPDAGAAACTPQTGQRSGKVFFKNLGNIPVKYTVDWVPYPHPQNRCDAGYPAQSDFTFSNVPTDGGAPPRYQQGTTQLPADAKEPPPWETAPVTINYRASSRCRDEASDLAQVVLTRQGDPPSRVPNTILLTADGTSRLPRGLNVDWSCGYVGSPQLVPCKYDFYGVSNAGDAPLRVLSVELYEELPNQPDGGMQGGNGPNGGAFQPCDFSNPFSDCVRFAWQSRDGGDPNQHAPHTIAPSPNPPQASKVVIGTMVFGPNGSASCFADGGACPNQLYRIYAVIQTDDPYAPTVISRVQGVAAPPP